MKDTKILSFRKNKLKNQLEQLQLKRGNACYSHLTDIIYKHLQSAMHLYDDLVLHKAQNTVPVDPSPQVPSKNSSKGQLKSSKNLPQEQRQKLADPYNNKISTCHNVVSFYWNPYKFQRRCFIDSLRDCFLIYTGVGEVHSKPRGRCG